MFVTQWAPSTQRTYNCLLDRFVDFVSSKGQCILSVQEGLIVEFLHTLSSSLQRPKSTLTAALAAVAHFYHALGVKIPINDQVHCFAGALVKTDTLQPLRYSSVFDISAFRKLFMDWHRTHLDMVHLCMKAIVLLSLSLMLRPSDIALNSLVKEKNQLVPRIFHQSQIVQQGEVMLITLFGNKNDYSRDGQQVVLQPSSDRVMCPVRALQDYCACMDRVLGSLHVRDRPVFMTLQRPFHALTASGIATILNKALQMAGLRGHSAKSFRPTGATRAVDAGQNPDTVRAVGRWKDHECFEFHYIHSRPRLGFTDAIVAPHYGHQDSTCGNKIQNTQPESHFDSNRMTC